MVTLRNNVWEYTTHSDQNGYVVYPEITFSVLCRDVMVQNGIFCTIGVQLYIVYYPIICIRKIKVYRVETMGMGISHWKNGVSGRNLISISTMVLIV